MNKTSKVAVGGGKYVVLHENGDGLRALRYGEPWREMPGDGLILALVRKIEELGEWVSVCEHLPEAGDLVLVYRPDAPDVGDPVVRTAFFGKHGRSGKHGFNCYVQPSHWRPVVLP